MSEYRIFETEQFQSDLQTNLGQRHEKGVARLRNDVYPQLRTQPFFGRNIKKLKGYKPETWRYRLSGFRLFYEIDDDRTVVLMIAADRRQKSY